MKIRMPLARWSTSNENLVERSLPIAFKIQGYILEPQFLEDVCKFPRHLHAQRLLHFLRRDLDARDLSVEPHAELPEAERLELFLAVLDSLDVLDGHRSSVRNAGTEASGGGTIPSGQTRHARKLADFRLRQLRIH